METSKEQILEKIFCNLNGVNSLELLHGKAKEEFKRSQVSFKSWISEAKLLIDDKYGYDFPSMLKVIEIIKPDFVFVDYVQMISTKGFRSKLDAIEEYVRKLAELAITQNFAAVLISQINRSGVEEPTMSKFKHAGVLEEHSRVCLILSYNKEKGTYIVNVEKNAFGQTGEFHVIFEPGYSRFRDFTDADYKKIEDNKKHKGPTGGLYSGNSRAADHY
jgi:replicative DNA helicase